jgi:hypothetical protein
MTEANTSKLKRAIEARAGAASTGKKYAPAFELGK